tara:strand:+ start:854 stop:2149 length:1296 start_codon:yes stop_codon:yes gene_type:complete
MNEYDSSRISDFVKKIDYKRTQNLEDADCYVLNTCHIREKATEKVYHDVGRIKKKFRNRKKPIVIISGCVAQAEGEVILKKEKYVDAVIGPQSYHQFNDIIKKLEENKKKINITEFDAVDKFDKLNHIKNLNTNVSSFLTIQEGCDKFCKFCVVPYTRGAEFSRSDKEILKECEELVENGVREITLLGQNVNAYNFKGKKLSNLISEISKINEVKRIRYTTSHPNDFSKDLIEIHSTSKKLMPLIHLPVQSGSNKILDRMNRKHNIEHYLKLIHKLKKINPLIKFSSDFIIGYPGETDKDFEETLDLIQQVEYINFFSFIFSPRPGTPSANLKQINDSVTKARLIKFQKVADNIKMQYRKKLFNSYAKVLFENKTKGSNKYFGRDEYLNSVIVESDKNLEGIIKNIKIIEGNQNTLYGKIEEPIQNKNFAA